MDVKKLQLLADVENHIKVQPFEPGVLSMYSLNRNSKIAVNYNGQGMMKAMEMERNSNRILRSSPWTNDYRVIQRWIEAMGIELAEYHPSKSRRKSVWAYINGERLCDVLELALQHNVMLNDMKKRLLETYPTIAFKVEVN